MRPRRAEVRFARFSRRGPTAGDLFDPALALQLAETAEARCQRTRTASRIQLLLGHSSLNTTAAYLRLDAHEIRREVLLKHPRERFA